MDDSWLYYLANQEISITVNGLTLENASDEEVLRIIPSVNIGPPFRYRGLKVTTPSGETTLIAYYSTITTAGNPPNSVLIGWISFARGGRPREIDLVAYSMPNPMTPQFLGNFMSCVSNTLAEGVKNIKGHLGLQFLGYVPDEFGRNYVAVLDEMGHRLNIQMLGSGISSMILLLLASPMDVVIYDNVENHLHKRLMAKLLNVMKRSKAQWFVTTQSHEFLEFLRDEKIDAQVWQFERFKENGEKVLVTVYKGSEIGEYTNKLGVDLRG